MFSEPGVAMNSATSPDGTSAGDVLAHLLAGDEQVLADVSQAGVAGGVGVVGDDRDPGVERLLRRRVERGQADQRDRDPVDAGADRAVERVDHLADVAGLRAGPLIRAAEQLARVGGAVLRRREERVGRHVVDERELVASGSTPKIARRAAAAGGRRRPMPVLLLELLLPHASRIKRREAGGPAGQRGAPSELAPALERGVVLFALIPLEALNRVVGRYLVSDICSPPLCQSDLTLSRTLSDSGSLSTQLNEC